MDPDPIVELLDDLDAHGAPSLRWTVQYSKGVVDPVQAAWNASEAPLAMFFLLEKLGLAEKHFDECDYSFSDPFIGARIRIKMRSGITLEMSDSRFPRKDRPGAKQMASVLRVLVPTLPPLQDMLKSLHGSDCGASQRPA